VANHKSAKKRARQTIVKNEANTIKRSASKNLIKKVREAIEAKDKATALSLLPGTQQLLDRLAKHGIIKANTAARKNSRLANQVNKL